MSGFDWRGAELAAEDTVVRGARVVDPISGIDAPHDVVLRDGLVAELAAPGGAELDGAELIEAEGALCVPAFFDPHVHLRTPGREDAEDIETGTRAAAAGGYCAVVAMANTTPPVDSPEHVQALRERAASEAAVPVGFVATVSRGLAGEELTDMLELAEAGAAGFSDDGLPIANPDLMRRALQYQRLTGLQIALHEQDPMLSEGGVMHEGEVSAVLGMTGWPSVAESSMIARDCQLALYEEARIHVQHLSAEESVGVIEAAKAQGVSVTCEASPHHLLLTDESVAGLDPGFKMNPPLRTERDRAALLAAVRSGAIDCIATDHAPHARIDKQVPFERAAFGVTGLETAFPALYTDLVEPGHLELGTLVERLGAGAAAFDASPATLTPGSEANLCLIDLSHEWEAGADGWESRSENSCFTGRRLKGRVLTTVARGIVAFRRRSFAMGLAGSA